MKRSQLITLIALIPLVVVGAVLAARLASDGGSSGSRSPGIAAGNAAEVADYEYVIPAGTGERLDAGERIEIIPAELEVRVGEVLRIVNLDQRGHAVGAFYVAGGETLTQRFSSPGELSGDCSIHPSGSFTLVVRA